ncbi:hypothetical protein BO70DRAFT_150302 [Aspergillus heteromorphus CBS 117.55]|uniref:Uncharacterized protein n=1 Tax=Aspergillus heteromorphus CBS 117.55 TaxID=1448321 RepID=A0A317V6P6_9EURO|nr:uncharacterized protein BO70DRAFT_150302 [Aspergillus heteromorphus CBS 117.55]PWY69129.1 hypothetical protein BO70DRAFT_150302 [Aspergillus heteromorphus CBS 117.55]
MDTKSIKPALPSSLPHPASTPNLSPDPTPQTPTSQASQSVDTPHHITAHLPRGLPGPAGSRRSVARVPDIQSRTRTQTQSDSDSEADIDIIRVLHTLPATLRGGQKQK